MRRGPTNSNSSSNAMLNAARRRSAAWPRAWFSARVLAWPALALIALAGASGCRSEMYEQARYEPLEPSDFFGDGASSRPLVAGTVAREDVRGGPPEGADAELFYTGWSKGKLAETVPLNVDRALLERGRERYQIFCMPCHGMTGDGRGMIVRRGFNPPPAYYSEELLQQPIGHFFDVMTRGFGTMYSYAARIPPRDRWAIAAYIRVLQLSQHADVASLPEEDRRRLSAAHDEQPKPAEGPGAGERETPSGPSGASSSANAPAPTNAPAPRREQP